MCPPGRCGSPTLQLVHTPIAQLACLRAVALATTATALKPTFSPTHTELHARWCEGSTSRHSAVYTRVSSGRLSSGFFLLLSLSFCGDDATSVGVVKPVQLLAEVRAVAFPVAAGALQVGKLPTHAHLQQGVHCNHKHSLFYMYMYVAIACLVKVFIYVQTLHGVSNCVYRIAGIIRGGIIFALFTVEFHPRKLNPRTIVGGIGSAR